MKRYGGRHTIGAQYCVRQLGRHLATGAAEEHTPHRDEAHFKGFPPSGDG